MLEEAAVLLNRNRTRCPAEQFTSYFMTTTVVLKDTCYLFSETSAAIFTLFIRFHFIFITCFIPHVCWSASHGQTFTYEIEINCLE